MIARILFTLNLFPHILVFHLVSSEDTFKPDTYFVENNWYRYRYTSTVESFFRGTTPSRSGFQFQCNIRLGVFTNFRSILKVDDCSVFHRIKQTDGGIKEDPYIKSDEASQDLSSTVSRYPLYFTFDNNKIDVNSIQIHKDETVLCVNIKRTIVSALQLELLSPDKKHGTIQQGNIFGLCPVHYNIYDHSPNDVYTSYDLTMCKMPQIFTLQMRLFSIIKKIHGGYRQTETLEPIYPFRSTVDCQYNIAESKIKTVECLQRQSFKPAEYNASIYTTAITDIRQSFTDFEMHPVSEGEDTKIPSDFKNSSLLFEFPEEENTIIAQKMVQDQLHTLVKSYIDLDLGSWPELYQDFVWFMKHSTEESLQMTIDDILSCHGNPKESCDRDKKMLEVEYFVDGLLSCATDACVTVFTKCVKEEHVSWITSRYFLYDLALNHEPTEESVLLVLDICKKSETISCWLPLSVMVHKFYVASNHVDDAGKKDGVIYKTISTLSDKLEKALEQTNGIDTGLVVRILKALGNIGMAVQDVYDTEGRLTNVLLNLTSSHVNHKITKSAIQVFENMKMTTIIRDKLVSIISDINRPSVSRTTAFSVLFMSADEDSMQKIINLIHTEQMDYMRTYMVSYVEGLLENDQPDKKWFRTAWQQALKEDGRPLPEIDDYLSGRSRYMELSRYFRLPFSVTHYGLQFEFDLVYDPASPMIQCGVLRINYYKDRKYNLLEISADIKGLEELLDALFGSKGKGLSSFLSMIAKARKDIEKGVNPQFADFDQKLSEALNNLIKMVNYPQFVLPDGIVSFKLYGYEVMYVDIGDVLATVLGHSPSKSGHPQQKQQQPVSSKQQQGRQQPNGFISNIIMMITRGYRLIKTRSAKVLDLTKVMPTLSGAPLNMTVLLTASMGLDVTAKADLSQYMKGSGPVQANADISTGFAGEFFGQMIVKFGDIAKAGTRMLASLNAKANLESSATLTKGSKFSTTLANYTAHFKRNNIEGQYDMAKIRSNLYHLHDDWIKIPVDVSVQKTVKKCTGSLMMLITGNTACVECSYPDVTDSVTHAYFPLSGPFSGDFVLSRFDKDMKEFNLEVNYLITNDTGRPKRQVNLSYSAPGKKLQRKVNINMEQSLISHSIVTNIDMPEMGLHLDVINKDIRNIDSKNGEIRLDYIRDINLQMKTLTVFRAMMQIQRNITEETLFDPKDGKDKTGNKTEMKTTLILAAPNIGLDINFSNLKEKLGSHISTKFNLKYYCSKHRPLMYFFHFRPKLAAANNDISEIEIVNDAMMGYKKGEQKLWTAEDSLHITYSGQKFSFSNDMLANDTHAHRKTVIKYIGSENKEETIEMNAHVENQTDQSNSHYCYDMTLEHKGRYDIQLKGHLHGNMKKRLTVNTDIDFKRKTPLKENLVAPLSKDLTITKDTDGECSIFKLNEWKMKINVTINAKPVFVSGQRRPKGVEFVWDVDVLYPNCREGGKIKSVGAIGSHLRNVLLDFRYWFRMTNSFISSKPRIYDVNFNFGYLKRHFFDYLLSYSGPGINASYHIHSDRYVNNTSFIEVKCHLESVWKLINFDYSENYTIIYKGSGLELTGVNHTLDATWAFFDIKLESSLRNESGLFINQDGYMNIRYPILPGITNISTQVTLSKTSRSELNIKLTRNKMEYFMDVVIRGPMAIHTSFSLKKPDGPKVFVVSCLSELVGSTSRESTIQWNPAFTKKGLAMLKAKKNKLSLALYAASKTLTKNLERSVTSMVIPFTNKTLGHVVSKVAAPVMYYLPLPSSMKKMVASRFQPKSDENIKNSALNGNDTKENIQHDDKRVSYLGQKVFGLVMKLESKLLALMSKMLHDPPLVVKNMVKKYITPNLYQAMKENKISFVEPLLIKWKHFLTYPRLTIGQKYILGRVRDKTKSDDHGIQTALLYDKSEILTFDGKLYQIKESSTCPHLLLADVKNCDFAVISTTEGVTVITKASMTSIHNGGQVFIDRCNKPVNLPYKTDELHTTKKNVSRVIHLDHGLTVSCDINIVHCNFELTNHENQTIGLLGNNDGEVGNDFKSPDGKINLNIEKLLSDYELGDSKLCMSPVTNRLSEVKVCEDLKHKCQDFFTSLQSPLAKCFSKVDSLSFSISCKERVKNCMPTSICPSVHAYISKCDIAGVTIEPSEQLDFCKDSYPRPEEIPSKALLDIIIVLYKEDSSDFCLPCIETFIKFLQTCDKTDVKLTFTQFDRQKIQLNEVLTKSTQHQFRLHTQKVVTVIKSDQDLSEADYNTLKDLYVKNNIVLNVISRYRILKYKGLVGLDWDHRIISISSISDETRELPKDFIIKLMSQTKGGLFNPMLLEKNRKTRMEGLVKHICERQTYTHKNCNVKKDNSEKMILKL